MGLRSFSVASCFRDPAVDRPRTTKATPRFSLRPMRSFITIEETTRTVKEPRTSEPLWLESVQLERFKAAFKPDPIPLQRFTAIIGRNGSGKSTLLEALQWLDTTLRQDARQACDRYQGIHDLINVRSQKRHFALACKWRRDEIGPLEYRVEVKEGVDRRTPVIASERLVAQLGSSRATLIKTESKGSRAASEPGIRILHPDDDERKQRFEEPDRLALGRGSASRTDPGSDAFLALQNFWSRAVFLRLSPQRLAAGSPARRKSFEPLLDEEGQLLPALLSEMKKDTRRELAQQLREVLHDITSVEVSKPRTKNDWIYYQLKETMPYVGQKGRGTFPIPSWMLSEGTRRITAIFALLFHDPPPSLLCIEEVENGLDPWTVQRVLARLESAADHGTQVLVSTHSPWVLDHVSSVDSLLQVERIEGETRYRKFKDRDDARRFSSDVPPGTRYVEQEA